MQLTFKRTDLIEKLEAKRHEMDVQDKNNNKELHKAAIAKIKQEIEEAQARLKRVQAETLAPHEYVNTSIGTYGPGYAYGRRTGWNSEHTILDQLITQLKLAVDENIKLGDRQGSDILRWLS